MNPKKNSNSKRIILLPLGGKANIPRNPNGMKIVGSAKIGRLG